jgi:hypothetical protein
LDRRGKDRTRRKGTGKIYRIVVRDEIGKRFALAFEEMGMEVEMRGGHTILTGEVIDQPHLHGILDRINGLGLELVRVEPLPEGTQDSNLALPNDPQEKVR